jgi:predicted Rossmann fold flavoprotein
MTKKETIYDVAVIGGGPAGMMAAGRAAECGAKVILLEKNKNLGKKLLITGGGRCNITNYETDIRRFLAKFKNEQKFLFSPFSQFGVTETIDFFNFRNMPTKIEAEGRIFPVSDSAKSVLEVLVNYLREGKVEIKTNVRVDGFICDKKNIITGINIKNTTPSENSIIKARNYILATGGKSRPETGSTGEGFEWLRSLGYNVPQSNAALVPIKVSEEWVKRLAGISLQDVKLTVYQSGKKQAEGIGKLLFTHFGISGPLALNMSREVGELLKYSPVELSLDLKPDLDETTLDKEIQSLLADRQNKQIRNCLNGLVIGGLAPILIKLANLNPEKAVNLLERKERLALGKLIKNLPMSVSGLMGLHKAVVTSGGADLTEIDLKTMRSRLHNNLFLIGDVLNINRPSGGYSLQLCWTTGFVAGTASANE